MNVSILWNVFVRDFRKQSKRIVLTLVAITWGTISIMLMLGFGEGLHQQLATNSKGIGEGIMVLWGNQTTIPFKGMGKGRPIRLLPEDVEFLKQNIPQIKYIGGEMARWGTEIRYGDKVVSEHVTGITPNYEDMRNHIPQMGGRMINQTDLDFKRRVAFLGYELKERLFGLEEDAIGKQIMVQGVPFTVVGVEIKKNQMNSYSGQDTQKLSMPLTTFEAIYGDPYLDNMVVQPASLKDIPVVKERIYTLMGGKKKFDPKDERALWVWDISESQREMEAMLNGIKYFLGIIGGLTLIIAGVGVANIMYVSIKERTREIGIKMAVGARKSQILAQFLLEALGITFAGGILGMSVTYLATEGFKTMELDSQAIEFMGRPTISTDIGIAVIAILGFMGLVSGFFPALRAASLKPVESLRYE